MLEQARNTLLLPGRPPGTRLPPLARPAPALRRDLRLHPLALRGERVEHRLVDLLGDGELAQLVRQPRPRLLQHLGVEGRAVRGRRRASLPRRSIYASN